MTAPVRVLLHNDDTCALAAKLRQRHPEAEIAECNSFTGLPEMVADFRPEVVYSVRFDTGAPFPAEALVGPGGPRWISVGGAGIDHLGHWDTGLTTVTNSAGVAADMMAEYVMGGFLHFTLDVPGLQRDKVRRVWNTRTVRPLKGETLLIVGLGHTGRAVAARAKAFGMHVIGTRARPEAMDNVDEVHSAGELLSLLPRAGFVVVATPLTPDTRGLIGANEIAAMKSGVILADVSRGKVVDQSALIPALESGHVAGAALDVFETEPLPADSPIWELENVIVSPHCSSVYEGWEQSSFDLFLENFDNWLNARPLFNVVSPDRGY